MIAWPPLQGRQISTCQCILRFWRGRTSNFQQHARHLHVRHLLEAVPSPPQVWRALRIVREMGQRRAQRLRRWRASRCRPRHPIPIPRPSRAQQGRRPANRAGRAGAVRPAAAACHAGPANADSGGDSRACVPAAGLLGSRHAGLPAADDEPAAADDLEAADHDPTCAPANAARPVRAPAAVPAAADVPCPRCADDDAPAATAAAAAVPDDAPAAAVGAAAAADAAGLLAAAVPTAVRSAATPADVRAAAGHARPPGVARADAAGAGRVAAAATAAAATAAAGLGAAESDHAAGGDGAAGRGSAAAAVVSAMDLGLGAERVFVVRLA